MPGAKILLVDDEEGMRLVMSEMLRRAPSYESVAVGTGEEALHELEAGPFELVVTDLKMPGMSGDELVEIVTRLYPRLPVIVVTSFGTIDNAVDVTRKGAYDYITKPFKAPEFLHRVNRALNWRQQQLEIDQKQIEIESLKKRIEPGRRQIVGNGRAIRRVLEMVPNIARNDASVVIYGESGTGKELIAHEIHAFSARATSPFVTLNCGALPETLLENELFGHVKGAYSDAVSDQPGLAREADGGSLFLDEIGEIGLPIQVKLLRFLQEREYRPLGSTKTVKSNVRIVAATNRDLREAIKQGIFREDLYYRLNIIPIHLPPLRDRREDIPILANHFLHKYAAAYGKKVEGFSKEAFQKLMNYGWPGNIRELENKIQQVLVIAPPGPIGAEQIVFEDQEAARSHPAAEGASAAAGTDDSVFALPFGEAKSALVSRFEKRYLIAALAANQGNVSMAARQAGKDRRAFFELMRKHAIDPKPFRKSGSRNAPTSG